MQIKAIQITEWARSINALTFAVRHFEKYSDKYEIMERGKGKAKQYALARPVGAWCAKMENREIRTAGIKAKKKAKGVSK